MEANCTDELEDRAHDETLERDAWFAQLARWLEEEPSP